MNKIIVTSQEELEEIIEACFEKYLLSLKEPIMQPEQKLLHSLRELADFLGCSVVTVHNLKKSGKIRFKQFGRKFIFNTTEIMEDLDRNRWGKNRRG